jgi:ribosome-associated protein
MNKKIEKPLAGNDLVKAIIASLNAVKAEKIVVINLKKLPGATDWFIIGESDNDAHIRACAHQVMEDLAKKHTHPWQREGLEEGRWILLDYSDVIVHIMLSELRDYYNLEELWSEGTVKKIEESWFATKE